MIILSKQRKVKCPVCGTFNEKELTVFSGNKYYCEICFDDKKKESQDYKDLCAYICELYNIESPTGWMFKQIKDYKENYLYTYKGMKTTLHYFFEIKKGNDAESNMGIGIIPYVYDEAKKYYYDLKVIKESVKNTNMEEITKINNVIKIKKTDIEIKDKYKNINMIDIGTL